MESRYTDMVGTIALFWKREMRAGAFASAASLLAQISKLMVCMRGDSWSYVTKVVMVWFRVFCLSSTTLLAVLSARNLSRSMDPQARLTVFLLTDG